MYNDVAQETLSFANYWHDPRHLKQMRQFSTFLPAVNGNFGKYNMVKARNNFARVQKAVFLGSPDDDCINPPLSSVFGFVGKDGKTPTTMYQSVEFQQDRFGLKTLHDENRLIIKTVPGFSHGEFGFDIYYCFWK